MSAVQETVARVREIDVDKYKYGFFTDIESVRAPKGLSEDIVRFISAKKNEPLWLLEWRLEAYRRWLTMQEPTWAKVALSEDRLSGSLLLFRAEEQRRAEEPRRCRSGAARDLRQARHSAERAGSAGRREGRPRVAVDAVFDSVSVVTTFKEELAKAGVIFCSISEAVQNHPDLVQQVSRHRSSRTPTISSPR